MSWSLDAGQKKNFWTCIGVEKKKEELIETRNAARATG